MSWSRSRGSEMCDRRKGGGSSKFMRKIINTKKLNTIQREPIRSTSIAVGGVKAT